MNPLGATLVALNVAFAYVLVARGQIAGGLLCMGAAILVTWAEGRTRK